MKFPFAISTIGVVILSLGIIFHFQGQGMIGPQSSFMYANPNWITYGIQIAIFGGIITAIGLGIKLLRR